MVDMANALKNEDCRTAVAHGNIVAKHKLPLADKLQKLL